ncbi:hypothetical protein J5N97_002797 [Dioscorea zingiberensis]|uniref:Uncharacterized protein n=1 Tax=Dioscorea zingiberensis TaxID=325984 RepID=A0A9D5D2Z2_9LILI|nr:hypothetical protein J5N97_002797 [Dioscorea zingiberensis]
MAKKRLNHNHSDPIDTMSLIDTLQRLGIAYHFDEEIESLSNKCFHFINGKHDLFGISLSFRLLMQRGHNVSSDVFLGFMNNNGSFKEELSKDLKGMQSLYETSHMAVEGDELLSQAMEFSKHHLKASMQYLDPNLAQQWRELGLAKKLPFARDRPLECFLWTVGLFPEPNFSECRIEVAKAVAILLVLDDVYDSYGCLDELILFTDAVQRWDIQAIEHLPEYMKICYMALYNSINETGCKVLKEHGWFIIPQLTKQDEQEGGDVASSIEICRKEHGLLSEEDARGRIRGLIDRCWKDLNKESICLSQLCHPIAKTSLNLARTSQLIYQHGDDERAPSVEHNIRSLLIEPIHHPGSVSD